jgi:hypothetical protein
MCSRRVRLTTLPPSVSQLSRENVGASTSHNPVGLHSLLQGKLYLLHMIRYDLTKIDRVGEEMVQMANYYEYDNTYFWFHNNKSPKYVSALQERACIGIMKLQI